MAFADDLLRDAHHLAGRGGRKPKQSSLRRAVSTAYYALFHLLIADFVSNWRLTDQRARLGRMFEHRKMSGAVLKLQDKKNPTAVEAELQKVISAFAQLQEDRYNTRPTMTSDGSGRARMSRNTLAIADEAFKSDIETLNAVCLDRQIMTVNG
ncbi:MAG: hypothetical protein HY235_25945 [Acidobacteria bacterium]|nr:hypothetical protein [Acidobacteriota bacterium]